MINIKNIRFGFEDPSLYGLESHINSYLPDTQHTRAKLLSNAVQITASLFPSLAEIWPILKQRLQLKEQIECFVLPDPQMRAYCFSHESHMDQEDDLKSAKNFTVVLSSGLVERLNTQEILAIVGHEVGHFIFEHWQYPKQIENAEENEILALGQLSRAAEISADRVAMIATNSLEDSCTAMIKVATGLGEPHITPDIRSYLRQFREITDNQGHQASIWSSHPMIPLRIRAMLRFDPIRKSLDRSDLLNVEHLQEIDKKIDQDFQKATNYTLEKIMRKNLDEIKLWAMISIFVADGVFSKNEQTYMEKSLGDDTTKKALSFLQGKGAKMQTSVFDRVSLACKEAQTTPIAERQKLISELSDVVLTFTESGEYTSDKERLELDRIKKALL